MGAITMPHPSAILRAVKRIITIEEETMYTHRGWLIASALLIALLVLSACSPIQAGIEGPATSTAIAQARAGGTPVATTDATPGVTPTLVTLPASLFEQVFVLSDDEMIYRARIEGNRLEVGALPDLRGPAFYQGWVAVGTDMAVEVLDANTGQRYTVPVPVDARVEYASVRWGTLGRTVLYAAIVEDAGASTFGRSARLYAVDPVAGEVVGQATLEDVMGVDLLRYDARTNHALLVPRGGDPAFTRVEVYDLSSGALVQTYEVEGEGEASVSPDGRYLLTTAPGHEGLRLYTLDAADTAFERVAPYPSGVRAASHVWSPDGQRTAFLLLDPEADIEAPMVQLKIKDAADVAPVWEGVGFPAPSPASSLVGWSPDGSIVVGHARGEGESPYYAIDVETGQRYRLPLDGELTLLGWMPQATETSSQASPITVYFGHRIDSDCARVHAVQRPGRLPTTADTQQAMRAALEQLFRGPTAAEREAGYHSPFSIKSADALIDVHLQGDTAYVNLKDIRDVMSEVSAPCGQAQFFAEVERTLQAVAPVERVLFAIEGDPEPFYEWVQLGCGEFNDDCDPAPFGAPREPVGEPSPVGEVVPTVTRAPTVAPVLPDGWAEYVNPTYGFSFHYPTDWTLTEVAVDETDPRGPSAPGITLQRGDLTLSIYYTYADEQIRIPAGAPAGDLVYAGKVRFGGEVIPRQHLVYENKVKAVYYGGGPAAANRVSGLIFGVSLHDTSQQPYEQVEIPERVITTTDRIIESFEISQAAARRVDYPDVIDGWRGVIASTPEGAQYDDYFMWHSNLGGRFGIAAGSDAVRQAIERLRDSGRVVEIWGRLEKNVPDVDGYQIVVERIEVTEPAGGSNVSQQPVEQWMGAVHKLGPGLETTTYLEREDGERFDITGANPQAHETLQAAAWTGARVQVCGVLLTGLPTHYGRQIQANTAEIISPPAEAPRNLAAFATASASSSLPADEAGTYEPVAAIDTALETAWVEGAPGDGVGEWLLVTFPRPLVVERLGISAGYSASDTLFQANNRIKRATLTFSSGRQMSITLDDVPGVQSVTLPEPVDTTYIRLTIDAVYPGARYDDTALAMIEVWAVVE
jgi:hypothetical protein